MLFRLNRARFRAAGWTLNSVLSLPVLAVRTDLFPTLPSDALPDAPPLPLLPAQRAVQARVDRARWSAEIVDFPRRGPVEPPKGDNPRLIFASGERRPLALDEDDRRYFHVS